MLKSTTQTTTHQAEIIGKYRPFGEGAVHGVTFDNELVAFDPDSEKVTRRDTKTGESIKTRAKHISGIESNGKGAFWCGGEGGKLRLVQKTAKS